MRITALTLETVTESDRSRRARPQHPQGRLLGHAQRSHHGHRQRRRGLTG